ncbi:MAG: DUF938 domain-containing protein [Pseudoxanthomonas sp.]
MNTRPNAPSCERNRDPILQVLRTHFVQCTQVLEIGSGTGQHALYFAAAMPWLRWQCSDRAEHVPGIRAWLEDAALPNTPAPVELDVAHGSWPASKFDAVFTANTLHIMGWDEVEAMFVGLGEMLAFAPGAASAFTLAVYGPFNYGGEFSSHSNRDFDASLRTRDPRMGIRDFEAVDGLARAIGLELIDDITMPANNRTLVWRRGAGSHAL